MHRIRKGVQPGRRNKRDEREKCISRASKLFIAFCMGAHIDGGICMRLKKIMWSRGGIVLDKKKMCKEFYTHRFPRSEKNIIDLHKCKRVRSNAVWRSIWNWNWVSTLHLVGRIVEFCVKLTYQRLQTQSVLSPIVTITFYALSMRFIQQHFPLQIKMNCFVRPQWCASVLHNRRKNNMVKSRLFFSIRNFTPQSIQLIDRIWKIVYRARFRYSSKNCWLRLLVPGLGRSHATCKETEPKSKLIHQQREPNLHFYAEFFFSSHCSSLAAQQSQRERKINNAIFKELWISFNLLQFEDQNKKIEKKNSTKVYELHPIQCIHLSLS